MNLADETFLELHDWFGSFMCQSARPTSNPQTASKVLWYVQLRLESTRFLASIPQASTGAGHMVETCEQGPLFNPSPKP